MRLVSRVDDIMLFIRCVLYNTGAFVGVDYNTQSVCGQCICASIFVVLLLCFERDCMSVVVDNPCNTH